MKKKKIVSLLLVGAQLAALLSTAVITSSAAVPYSDFFDAQKIISTASAPTIDGNLDEWTLPIECKKASGAQSVKFDMKWDTTYLYIAASVTNDTNGIKAEGSWGGDIFSLYFDPTMHQSGLDNSVYDLQVGIGYKEGSAKINFGGSPATDVMAAWNTPGAVKTHKVSDSAWNMEAKIPLSIFRIENTPDTSFGFNIDYENSDGSLKRWAENGGVTVFWDNTSGYGKVTLKAPAITEITSKTANLVLPLNTSSLLKDLKFSVKDAVNDSYELDGLYKGLQVTSSEPAVVDIADGKLIGKSVGSSTITFAISDTIKTSVKVDVKNAALISFPQITAKKAYVGSELSFTVNATNSLSNPMTYSVKNPPAGSTFDATTRTFKWTPSEAQKGNQKVTFVASDADISKEMTVDVTVNETPVITVKPVADVTAQVGKSIGVVFNVEDSLKLPITSTVANAPAGSSCNSVHNYFTWTPTADQIGTHELTFTFTDGIVKKDMKVKFNVTGEIVGGVSFKAIPTQKVNAGSTVSFKVEATSAAGKTIAYSVNQKPNDATFDTTTHVFTWVTSNSDNGSYNFRITANDGDKSAVLDVPITVIGNNNNNNYNYGGGYVIGGGGGGGYTGGTGMIPGTSSTANQPSAIFKDMGNYQWASEAVDNLYQYNIIKGVTKDQFAPGAKITRADFVVLLMRTFKFSADTKSNFSDVKTNDYYSKEVAAAKALGIIGGQGDNKFNPKAPISRQDMMVILNRALKKSGLANNNASQLVLNQYADKSAVPSYATEAVANLVSNKLIAGTNGNILPAANTTRAEVAVIIHRMVLKYGTALIK